MSTARATSPSTSPTDLPAWAIPTEDLEAMLATDDDSVDTAAIPRLAFREAVEESATTSEITVATVEDTGPDTTPESDVEAVMPVGHSLRSRHASPESVAAIRRNLVAFTSVIVSVVVVGVAATWLAGWVALAVYSMLVLAAAVAVRRVDARYAPRHSRYSPRPA